jgi:hypothetical protein
MLLRKKLQKKAKKGRCALPLALAGFGDSKMLPSLFRLTDQVVVTVLAGSATGYLAAQGTVLTVDGGFNAFSGV